MFFRLHLLKKWPLWLAILIVLVAVAIVEYHVLAYTHGVFSYPFDDAYIHLAISKNLAFHGVWGVSDQEFSSASSSLLYPILMAAAIKIFGATTWVPLLLNVIPAITLLIVVQRWLDRQDIKQLGQFLMLLVLIVLAPLPAVIIFGMEHTFQLLFCFLFIYQFSDALGKIVTSDKKDQHLPFNVYVYGMLVVATRYEGVFIIAPACLLLLWRRRWVLAWELGLIACLPILLFGFFSLFKGSYFIPNSVVVKSGAPPMTFKGIRDFLLGDGIRTLYHAHNSIGGTAVQWLLFILPVSYLLFIRTIQRIGSYGYIILILTACTFMHLLFARTGTLYRYEVYLTGGTTPVLTVLFAREGRRIFLDKPQGARWVLVFIGLFLIAPLLQRSWYATKILIRGSINIYDQQYQMGLFLHQYYDRASIASCDIGAISYLTHTKNMDLEGLGTLDVAKSRKENYRTPAFLNWLARRDSVKIAVIFDAEYGYYLYKDWKKVATWQISRNMVCYSDVVTFYALDTTEGPLLRKNLQTFQPKLPKDVLVTYYP